jgi:predicted amidohydrolase
VYAEFIPATRSLIEPSIHPTTAALSDAAREHGIFLVGGRWRRSHGFPCLYRTPLLLLSGSIPERDSEGHIFNSCVVFGPDGEILAKHRKVGRTLVFYVLAVADDCAAQIHLFDIDIPGRSEKGSGGS